MLANILLGLVVLLFVADVAVTSLLRHELRGFSDDTRRVGDAVDRHRQAVNLYRQEVRSMTEVMERLEALAGSHNTQTDGGAGRVTFYPHEPV